MHATPTMAAPMSRAPASLSRGQAAAAAVARPPVPTNLIGKPLDQTPWVPFAPAAERLVTVRLYIDGARMKPPQERLYEDQILWNAYEPAESVRKFSEELCMAEGLPAAYRDEIERAIGRAVVAAEAAAHDEAEVPPAGTLTIDVEVERRGKAFRDKVLWDLGGAITPEEYARRTAADLKLPLDIERGSRSRSARRCSSARRAPSPPTSAPRRSSARRRMRRMVARDRSAAARAAAAAAAARRARAAAAAEARAAAKAGEWRAAGRVDCGGALERGGVRRAQFGAIRCAIRRAIL